MEMASAAGRGPRRFAARMNQGANRRTDSGILILSRKLDLPLGTKTLVYLKNKGSVYFLLLTTMSNAVLTKVPHLMTLADLSVPQINRILAHSHHLKQQSTPWLLPHGTISRNKASKLRLPPQSLFNKTIALIFSKRSTRTRIAAETSAELLGGRALFLGKEDIQLGVNESYRDTARVIGGMTQGIFARVGDHSEIEVSLFPFFFITYPT